MRLNRYVMGLLCLVSLLGYAVGQTRLHPKPVAPKSNLVPANHGPIGVEADSHFKRLLVNQQVRVFRVAIAPNEATQLSAHPHDYIVVSLGNNNFEAVGEVSRFAFDLQDGEARVLTGGWSHKLVNKSAQPSNLVIMEVVRGIAPTKSICGLAADSCHETHFGEGDEGRYNQTMLFETSTVRLLRADLGPSSSLPKHEDQADHLVVPLTQLHLAQGTTDMGDASPGQASWAPGKLGTLRNLGTQDARMLILEIK